MSVRESLDARLIADFSGELGPDEKDVTFGFSISGQILVASRLSRVGDYKTLLWSGDSTTRVDIRGEFVPCSYIQPMPDGVLIVGARCVWKESSIEQNAVVYDLQGHEVRRFTLGDGINDVRSSADGAIWVSYFDEGIFGNRGWNHPGPAPIGESGLVQFDQFGNVLQSFDAFAAGTGAICDAYAFNLVATNDAWVYFYTDFPVVRMHGGTYRTWTYGGRGASAIAVSRGRVALFGDYEDRSTLRILELTKAKTAKVVREASVTIGNSKPPNNSYGVGVGGNLYLVSDRKVFLLDYW